MKLKSYRVDYVCPDCFSTHRVVVVPYTPAITSHQYEDNEEADGGYCEPDECECGCSIDYEYVQEHE
jgi:hypothetical protein